MKKYRKLSIMAFVCALTIFLPFTAVADDLNENYMEAPEHSMPPGLNAATSWTDVDNGDGTRTFTMLVDEASTPPNYNGPWYVPTPYGNYCGFEYYSWFNQDYGWVHTFDPWDTPYLNIISAQLTIVAWDIDSEPSHGYYGEYDGVHIDGTLLSPGYLQGYNNQWSTTVFDIPISTIIDDGVINVWLDIDMHHTTYNWATTLDYSYLQIHYMIFPNDPPLQPEVSWGYLADTDCITGGECITYGEGLLVEVVGPTPPDPDGDDVTYEYRWFVDIGTGGFIDDEFAGRGDHTGNTVPPEDIQPQDIWQVQIIPTDEHGAAGEQVTVTFPPFCTVDCPYGCIDGHIMADCPDPGTPLYGVTVDIFEAGSGALIATAVTDVDGYFNVCDILVGDYLTTVVTPLGYSATPDEQLVTVVGDQTVTADFAMVCQTGQAEPRTIGYWKHQVGVATGGNGHAQVDATTLCGYLDMIENHFNNNAINQVIIYQSPSPTATCDEKFEVAKELLNLKGSVSMLARARQQLMALLLNVAAGYIHQTCLISEDGATVSQAITYCDMLIDDGDPANDEMAKSIADWINNNEMVAAGIIPLSTANIAYRLLNPDVHGLAQNFPNPFNPRTSIAFNMPTAGEYRLEIFNVAGQRVRIYAGEAEAGINVIVWNGTDEDGQTVASGLYLYRITTGDFVKTRKMVLMK
jgi:hypothetical protein